MSEEIRERVRSIFLQYGVNITESDEETLIDDVIGIDSISYIQILNHVARDFGFKIDDTDLLFADLTTFNKIVEFSKSKCSNS
ncbi:acyl carrier protein [Paenibacillus paeoniae]|uniref:Acyl carrier protein n=1 Tax=Paenibacillus paeoniae TaxID=2292705 RepID=A0A371P0E5_9BACL|nr:acyl carrier protein [Paenibacillus paeoniae]REK69098.1 acyl carrier protein [Paenibacillus paeoniae]